MILLGSALGFALMFCQGSYATDDNSDNGGTVEVQDKDAVEQKNCKEHKCYKKHDCKNIKKKLEKIIKKIEDSESLFEKEPAKYFKQVSFNTIALLKAYKCCEKSKDCKDCTPSEPHVETVKLYATMFEAWANASKEEDKIDKDLLSNAHEKVPEIIKSAKSLLENCAKKADKKSDEEADSEPEEKDE